MTNRPVDLESALCELDACRQAMKAMSEEMAALRELLKQTTGTLNVAMSLPAAAMPEKRGRGRPKKVIDDEWMLEWFPKAKAEFVAANKYVEPRDNAVLTWHFERLFIQHGKSASKARSPAFQRKLKTFRNRLSDVRNMRPKLPDK